MNDLISRQAAIDAITDESIVRNMDSVYDSELHRCKRATHRILASLQSAQPERKKVGLIDADELSKAKFHPLPYTHIVPADLLKAQTEAYERGWNDAIDAIIENAETVEPQQWIPVSKLLPEDLHEVNITWVNHNPEPYYDFVKDKHCSGSAVYYKGSWYWYSSTCVDILAEYGRNEMDKIDDGIEVVAWMPLPEPWTGGDADGT